MPSASTWWTLWMIAMRLSARPSATYISHSGRLRSSGVLAISPISWSSSRRPPGRHPRLANVIVEVDVVVHHPHRVMQLERDMDELMAKRRQRLQPRIRDVAEQVEGVSTLQLGHIEHANLQRVHVDLGCLGVEHQGVHAV